ncbi:Cell division protein FtsA [bioreactor metagenome]|uniref:Cell division protein FtsA n=1 Tax=bioreactor metagenome TaxID=1076179 RepID=A0A645B3G9_9ZZZZ
MTQSGFIAAIDLGTSKITGIIGRKNESNVISVLECVSLPSENSIRRGTIYNIDKASAIVRKLISMLENALGKKIGKVYVSLGGQSVHTEVIREMKQLSSSGIVTENVVEQLRNEADKYKPDLKRKYAIGDVEYFLDDKPEKNPVGVTCSVVEAEYQIVVGRPNLAFNIEKTIVDKGRLQIADFIVAPLAAAAITLTEEEKELGCAFVDFGAGTTTLSVYKGGLLRRMVTIPFGGKNITRDIAELNFVESEAEQYKIKFGKARESNESSLFSSPFSSKPDIDLVELNKVIVMRLDEITANIKEQIRLSGYQEQLGAGLVVTGGASQLRNLEEYLTQKLDLPVRKASSRKALVNNTPEYANDPALATAMGMLLLAHEDCEKIVEEPEEEVQPDQKSKGSVWSNFFGEKEKTDKVKEPNEKGHKNKKEKSINIGGKMKNMFSTMFEEEEDDQ